MTQPHTFLNHFHPRASGVLQNNNFKNKIKIKKDASEQTEDFFFTMQVSTL